MGVLTLAEMETDLRFQLDNRSDLTSAQLQRWLNWAWKEITDPRRHRHSELQCILDVTTAGPAQFYDIEVGTTATQTIRSIHTVVFYPGNPISASVTRYRLRQVDVRQLEDTNTTVATANPTRYAIWNNTASGNLRRIMLDSIPTAINHHILIYGYREPDNLSGAGAASFLADAWDEAIVLGARWRGWRDLNQPDRSELAKNDYLGFIAELERERRAELEDRPGLITSEMESLAVEVPAQ